MDININFHNRRPIIFICGNGGLASHAEHFAAELMGKFGYDVYIPCLSLTCNSALITALANDLGFEYVFSHQLEVLAKKGDTLIVLTTSKLSKDNKHSLNLYNAVQTAYNKKMKVILLDQDNLQGETTAEKQNWALAFLHNLALELKRNLHSKEKVL